LAPVATPTVEICSDRNVSGVPVTDASGCGIAVVGAQELNMAELC
jgi:hypothetical protein